MIVYITVVSRQTAKVINTYRSFSWTINVDGISPTSSSFSLIDPVNKYPINPGDFVICKVDGDMFKPLRADRVSGEVEALYYGIVDSYSNKELITRDFTSVLNVNCLLYTPLSGENRASTYIYNLIQDWIFLHQGEDTGYQGELSYGIPGYYLDNVNFYDRSSSSGWKFRVDDGLEKNIWTFSSELFKESQVMVRVRSFSYDEATGMVYFHVDIIEDTRARYQINAIDYKHIVSVNVYSQEVNIGRPNAVGIMYPDSTGIVPRDTKIYWVFLLNDGTYKSAPSAASVANMDIRKPIMPTYYFASDATEDKMEIAEEVLNPRTYSHMITCSYDTTSDFGSDLLDPGRPVAFTYNGVTYQTVITGFSISSSSTWASVVFGNIRHNLQVIADELV